MFPPNQTTCGQMGFTNIPPASNTNGCPEGPAYDYGYAITDAATLLGSAANVQVCVEDRFFGGTPINCDPEGSEKEFYKVGCTGSATCGDAQYSCRVGTASGQSDNGTLSSWTCSNSFGSTTCGSCDNSSLTYDGLANACECPKAVVVNSTSASPSSSYTTDSIISGNSVGPSGTNMSCSALGYTTPIYSESNDLGPARTDSVNARNAAVIVGSYGSSPSNGLCMEQYENVLSNYHNLNWYTRPTCP